MATNFEIITKTPGTLGRFMSELDRELTMKGDAVGSVDTMRN